MGARECWQLAHGSSSRHHFHRLSQEGLGGNSCGSVRLQEVCERERESESVA